MMEMEFDVERGSSSHTDFILDSAFLWRIVYKNRAEQVDTVLVSGIVTDLDWSGERGGEKRKKREKEKKRKKKGEKKKEEKDEDEEKEKREREKRKKFYRAQAF